jgi:hypothetical protein
MKLARISFAVGVLVATAALAGSAFAQPYIFDPPTIHSVGVKPSSLRLSVTAGPSGAPVGFGVEWMKRSDYDAGGWPTEAMPALKFGQFSGTPSWVLQGSSKDFQLDAWQWHAVELGQLFDESGLGSNTVDELEPSTEYAVRAYVLCDNSHPGSPYSETLFITTAPAAQNCTFTLGYWKNHVGAWPVTSLTLGTVAYNQADLLAILNQPAGGNGLLILMHQLIAAKLNAQNGADASSVAADIAAADALIGTLVPPPLGTDTLAPAGVNALATSLDDFNNGLIGPGHCATTPARPHTWGEVKATYRR